MKCPRCGKPSSVAETRPGDYHTTRRRRVCSSGHRFTTVEIHSQAYGSVRQRLAEFSRTLQRRWATWARDARIAAARRGGATLDALATRFDLTKSGVAYVLKRMGL